MAILGLDESDMYDESMIKRMWKQHVRKTHPDKNDNKEAATRKTQRLNQAKDICLNHAENLKRHHREKFEQGTGKTKTAHDKGRQDTGKKQHTEKEENKDKTGDSNKTKEQQQSKPQFEFKKMNASGSRRVHRKVDAHKQGKALVAEIETFFKDNFVAEEGKKIPTADILKMFIDSRGVSTDLEINLFKRHSKRLFLAVWPEARYSTCMKNMRCFMNIAARKVEQEV